MLDVEEARARILKGFEPLETIEVLVGDALGMAVASDLRAPHPLPRFDNSAMDGYAVSRADVAQTPVTLPVVGEVRAGDAGDVPLSQGAAVRIMTGAPIPPGADAVVPVEDTEGTDDEVTIAVAPGPAAHIRPAGDD